jgi:small GTP-binding protein
MMNPMMTETAHAPLTGQIAALRESAVRVVSDIAAVLDDDAEPAAREDRQRLLEIADDLRTLFYLIVVIGEFNAGKSTFVNALLGEPLLPSGITPTTERVELVRYHPEASRVPIDQDESMRIWQHPNTGAPGVALVDTPGTGSVFMKHEKTAKGFLHRSDLVIFLLSAKRALAETERLYLELAQSYGKKIVLVINQIDLIAPHEREEVRRFVESQVDKLLGIRPLIFMVSARNALNGAAAEAGAMDALRAHLRGVLQEAPPARQKLLSQLETAERILERYRRGIDGHVAVVASDDVRVRDVQREMEQQAAGLEMQLKNVNTRIALSFAAMRDRGDRFVRDRFTLRRLVRPMPTAVLERDFRESVLGTGMTEIELASRDYVNILVDGSRQYWRGIIDRLQQLRERLQAEMHTLDEGIYVEQRDALERAIASAEGELRAVSGGRLVEQVDMLFRSNFSAFTTSAIVAFSGAVVALAAAAPATAVLAVPATAIAFTIGLPAALIGSGVAGRYLYLAMKRSRQEMKSGIDALEKTYTDALAALTQREKSRLTGYGQQVLMPFFSRLEVLGQRYTAQRARYTELEAQIEILRRGIEALK